MNAFAVAELRSDSLRRAMLQSCDPLAAPEIFISIKARLITRALGSPNRKKQNREPFRLLPFELTFSPSLPSVSAFSATPCTRRSRPLRSSQSRHGWSTRGTPKKEAEGRVCESRDRLFRIRHRLELVKVKRSPATKVTRPEHRRDDQMPSSDNARIVASASRVLVTLRS